MTRHPHADIIHAWAEGAEVECKNLSGEWDINYYPIFYLHFEYRIKPKEPEWRENIPEHGVLVWHTVEDRRYVILVKNGDNLEHFTPLTNEEIDLFKR